MRILLCVAAFLSMAGTLLGQEKPAAEETGKAAAHSTIVFFRESHMTGAGLRPSVYVDGREVGRLTNGRWFSYAVEPGKHKLESSAKNQPVTVVETAAGETTYVQMVIVAGTWRGGGRLLQVDADGAQKVIAKLKPNEREGLDKK